MNNPINQYAYPDVLVSTQWLSDHLNDDNLRIVEVDMSPNAYQSAHIPGAIFWNVLTDLLKPDLSQNLEPAAVSALLSRSGITPETTVVAYGSYPGTGGWIFWLLSLIGHRNLRVLNGGYQKWRAEQRPVADALSTVEPTEYGVADSVSDAGAVNGTINGTDSSSLRTTYKQIQASLNSPAQVLLDVRSDLEYQGKQFLMKPPEGHERAGHIPGAVHMEHTRLLAEDGTFKSFEALQALCNRYGITADKTIVPYCAIGARAGFVWFVLTYLLGYDTVRNYDGSWNEWSRLPDAPVDS